MKTNLILKTVTTLLVLAAATTQPAARGAETAKAAAPAAKTKAAPAPKSEKAATPEGVAEEKRLHHERREGEELVIVTTGREGNPAGAQFLRQAYHLLAA